jgi:hypothetical protein
VKVYFYRRRVPLDLRDVVKRRELVRSLGTSKLAEARKQAILLDAEVYRLFDALRERRGRVDEERLIEVVCEKYRRKLIADVRKVRRGPRELTETEYEGIAEVPSIVGEKFLDRDFSHVRADAVLLLAEEGVALDGEAFEGLLYELARTSVDAYRRVARETDGDLSGQPRELLTQPSAVGPSAAAGTKFPRLLSVVIQLYIEENYPLFCPTRIAGVTMRCEWEDAHGR